MEMNRDEALKCLRLAEKFLNDGSFDKATKFAQKSDRLYESNQAKGQSFK